MHCVSIALQYSDEKTHCYLSTIILHLIVNPQSETAIPTALVSPVTLTVALNL